MIAHTNTKSEIRSVTKIVEVVMPQTLTLTLEPFDVALLNEYMQHSGLSSKMFAAEIRNVTREFLDARSNPS